MSKITEWKWFGVAAHLCVSERCLFHMATDVGDYLVSTVGEFYPNMNIPPERGLGKMEDVGCDRKYGTCVFKKLDGSCKCGCELPNREGSECEGVGANDAKTAQDNHMEMCHKYCNAKRGRKP